MSAAATASSCQLEGEEKEAYHCFLAFLSSSSSRVTAAHLVGEEAQPAAASWVLRWLLPARGLLQGGWLCGAAPPPAPTAIAAAPRAPAPAGCASAPSPSLPVSLLPHCQEEASKLSFLASIHTLCRAWLEGRYRPSSSSLRELLGEIEVLQEKESPCSTDGVMWQQAALAIIAMSEEKEVLMKHHLCHCIHSIFCLAPAQETDSQHASLHAEILRTLDGILEVLVYGALQSSSNAAVEGILEVLLPFMASQEVATRRRALGRVVHLSQFCLSSWTLEDMPFRKGNLFLFKEKPMEFLGQLMGHVTLSCAEEDQEIRCMAAEALSAFHSFVLQRQGCKAAREDQELTLERESANTFWPTEPADKTTMFASFLLPQERSSFVLTVLRSVLHPKVSDTQTLANVLEVVLRRSCSDLAEVEEITQTIHVQLAYRSEEPLQDILRTILVQVAHLNPQKVTTGLLQASPHCDSTARAMWRILASEPCLVDSVLKTLLLPQEGTRQRSDMAECSCCHSLAVASAMHEVFLMPSSQGCVQLLLDELFMAVVFQLSFSLKSLRQGCCTAGRQSRIVVSTMQALFYHLGGASLLEDIGRQGAWDALLSPDTYHTGIAVLTRVLRHEAPACCPSLSARAARGLQDIGAMAVFVELLDCNNLECVDGDTLDILQFHLRSESSVLRRMAVTSLVVLSGRPERAATLQGLLPELTRRLLDDDNDIKTAALTVLRNTLCLVDRQTAVPIALQLLAMLLPLFENESSYVRERSVLLCRDAVDVAVSTHKEQMRKDVQRSLMPLFFHLHDEERDVAQASREALLGAAKLLKRRQLRKLLETEQTQRVAECLLAEKSSRAEEYLDQSLPYLQSPQEPLREAACRFIGLAGQRLRDGHQEKLQAICEALRDKAKDSSPSVSSLALQTLLLLRPAVEEPPSGFSLQALRYRLRRAWRRTTRALGDGWLCCRSCVQS